MENITYIITHKVINVQGHIFGSVTGNTQEYVEVGKAYFRLKNYTLTMTSCTIHPRFRGERLQLEFLQQRLLYCVNILQCPIYHIRVTIRRGIIASYKNVLSFAMEHSNITFHLRTYSENCIVQPPKNVLVTLL